MSEDKDVRKGAKKEKDIPAQIFAEDMCEDWSKDAIAIARMAFGQQISAGLL